MNDEPGEMSHEQVMLEISLMRVREQTEQAVRRMHPEWLEGPPVPRRADHWTLAEVKERCGEIGFWSQRGWSAEPEVRQQIDGLCLEWIRNPGPRYQVT